MIYRTFIVLVFLFVFLIHPAKGVQPNVGQIKKTTIFFPGGKHIEAVIADDQESRTTGLMGSTHLDLNQGMLFIFDLNEPHMMWMKNMNIPIDIVWLNEQKAIIDFVQSAPPCKPESCVIFGPLLPSRYILEIKDGASKTLQLKKGVVLRF